LGTRGVADFSVFFFLLFWSLKKKRDAVSITADCRTSVISSGCVLFYSVVVRREGGERNIIVGRVVGRISDEMLF
jgi:hypothetical protein